MYEAEASRPGHGHEQHHVLVLRPHHDDSVVGGPVDAPLGQKGVDRPVVVKERVPRRVGVGNPQCRSHINLRAERHLRRPIREMRMRLSRGSLHTSMSCTGIHAIASTTDHSVHLPIARLDDLLHPSVERAGHSGQRVYPIRGAGIGAVIGSA